MIKNIAIVGLGWLGQPLAVRLSTIGYIVIGSVTTLEKAKTLQQNGINAFKLEISENGISGEIKVLMKNTDCLIIMVPPGLRKNTGANYVLKMKHLLKVIEASEEKKVIFISSTSVYGDAQGKVTENDAPKPETNAGQQLLEAQNLFADSKKIETAIVRFGGLYGGSREPARFLAGRKDLNDGNAPVNLIHRKDCIAIIEEILKRESFGYVFNAVNPQHPKKSDYYIMRAKALGLEPPTFSEANEGETFKQVDSENLQEILKYQFTSTLV
ncbi:SDR family oxidoreductase [Aequorivita echinoideorum]|uniref:SDR family oxidoreductase n=1 Tax=Aequorivita echinoideorum TaxID=1549647 RepID=A0ABS5S1Z6_9FLAO|nr:SDR family oxidoreductase [Aequorivita echinoideorum]MBT0607234.1 SDR family oxidoreductase [Aequorivita echinoideorum]